MKRYASILAVLLVAVLAFYGCGKKDNPYEPNTDAAMGSVAANLINSGAVTVNPALGGALFDIDGTTTGIQAEIIITFPVNMNPATVNLTNIQVDAIQNGTCTYYPELKKAVISGTWTAGDYWVKVIFTTNVRGQGGGYIDGNGNGRFDGAPYDNKNYYIRVGAPVTPAPDFIHPALLGGAPYGSGVNHIYPQFYCRFDNNDIDSNLVRANFSVRDSTGRSLTLKSDGTAGGPGSWFVLFRPTGSDSLLIPNAPYRVVVNLAALHDTNGNQMTWTHWEYEPNAPATAEWPFRTDPTTAGDYVPLHYSGLAASLSELVITFDDSLDYSTVTTNTVKVFKLSGGVPAYQVYGRIYTQPSDISARKVRFTMVNATSGSYQLYLSRNIRDNAGWYLDANLNGIGGEAGIPGWNIPSDDYKIGFSL